MDEKDYEKLLDVAKSKLPEIETTTERLKIPELDILAEGNKTIIRNMFTIANILRRDPEQMMKYFMKHFATPGYIRNKKVILGRKILKPELKKTLTQYIEDFVICPVCQKPDTVIISNGAYGFLKCNACGSKTPIKIKL